MKADLPLMLQAAYDYIKTQRTGRTEVWICSDLRANDWTADSGRWKALRDAFSELPQGIRFQLLAYPQQTPGNVTVRVMGPRFGCVTCTATGGTAGLGASAPE